MILGEVGNMKYTHLKYDMIGAHLSGVSGHPQKVLKDLGIEYEKAVPQSMGDCWQLFNASNLPQELPSFLKVFDVEPIDYIGWGLSEEEARKLSTLTTEEADQFILNKELEREMLDERQRQKQKELSGSKQFSYNIDDVVITIGGVEVKGCDGLVLKRVGVGKWNY